MNELSLTKPADDIDMLINIISQMSDYIDKDDLESISTQLPDPTCHCKYWEEIGVWELVKALEKKYEGAARLEIPSENQTNF